MAPLLPNNQPNKLLGLPSNSKAHEGRVIHSALRDSIVDQLKLLDMQDAIKRYVWHNLPNGLTSELMERMLYYRGQVMFFYDDLMKEFVCLPYKFASGVNYYGRYNRIGPVPFFGPMEQFRNGKDKTGGWTDGFTRAKNYLKTLEREVAYEEVLPENLTYDDLNEKCVIIKDYTSQESELIVPRKQLMDELVKAEAEAFPMARTALLANSGIKAMRTQNQDDAANVYAANEGIENAAITGKPFVPIVAPLEFQDLTSGGSALKAEEYLIYMQALDNYRLSLYGLKNGGLFQKKSHMLESEQEMNDGNTLFAMQDGLDLRQQACNIINSIWGLGIWCEQAEQVSMIDSNGDGEIGNDENTQTMEEDDMNE
jgi:hypothetical protein